MLIANISNHPLTELVPSDSAFANYKRDNGVAITSLNATELLPIVQYHVLVGMLDQANLSPPQGVTVPTLLNAEQYNNRTPGALFNSEYGADRGSGQVVVINSSGSGTSSARRFTVRRSSGASVAPVRSGMDATVNMTFL